MGTKLQISDGNEILLYRCKVSIIYIDVIIKKRNNRTDTKRKGFRCVNINIIDDKKYEISRRYNLIWMLRTSDCFPTIFLVINIDFPEQSRTLNVWLCVT